MLKKQAPRKKRSSFLTPEFLRKQGALLEAKLADCKRLQNQARQGIEILPLDERRGDSEQVLTLSEQCKAVSMLDNCREINFPVRKALDLINNLLSGGKNEKEYGRCLGCGKQISEKRLTAVPWAERCVPCQQRIDMIPLNDSLLED